jgi:hypothetical protein
MKELDTPVTIRFIPIHAGEEDDTENYYLFISEQIQYQLRYARNPFILDMMLFNYFKVQLFKQYALF